MISESTGPLHQIVAPEEINIQCHTNHYHFRKILPGSQAGPWRHLKWLRDGLDQLVRNMLCPV